MERFEESDYLSSAPAVLLADPGWKALLELESAYLQDTVGLIENAVIWARAAELSSRQMATLAYDLKADWWDESQTDAEKLKAFENIMAVHRMMGTKAAIVRGVEPVYPNTTVEEWWEYGGEPYHFRLQIRSATVDQDKLQSVLDRVKYYKNARSVMDEVAFLAETVQSLVYALAVCAGLGGSIVCAAEA